MCGIAGIWRREEGDAGELMMAVERMSSTLVHRGPDDAGTWIDAYSGVALGFRRLAILDLSAEGRQPMQSASGRYVIVFNGEVYNFADLRRELVLAGHTFRGGSDTEVVLAAFDEWGVRPSVERFVGMFAFAVWDRRHRTLCLGRDRLGVKPLYYGTAGGALLFASELKALAVHPDFDRRVDRDALALLLQHSYIPHPHTIYRNVRQLTPGCLITFTVQARAESPAPYWSVATAAEQGIADPFLGSEHEATEELAAVIDDAIRLRMVADVPVGAFLSGGVDSSLVVARMQRHSRRPVKTFTIGFRESGYDEAAFAKQVAVHLGTDHTELYVTDGAVRGVIPELPDLYDEPFADTSQLPTFLLSRLAREQVTVALSGDGGDEAFGGYSHYLNLDRSWNARSRVPCAVLPVLARVFQLSARAFGTVPQGLATRLAGASRARAVRFAAANADDYHAVCSSYWPLPSALVVGVEPTPVRAEERSALSTFTSRMMVNDGRRYLPDCILTKVDRASMAVSLEVRSPLLDHRVVEFAWRLPMDFKIRNGEGKRVLRHMLRADVPLSIVNRPKHGFSVPVGEWLRGPLREWAEALLDERRLRQEGYLDPLSIRTRWESHLQGKSAWYNTDVALWSVLAFQAWHDRWLKAVPQSIHSSRALLVSTNS
jgi:asparagine synthase (glutamine-hydrolysing)